VGLAGVLGFATGLGVAGALIFAVIALDLTAAFGAKGALTTFGLAGALGFAVIAAVFGLATLITPIPSTAINPELVGNGQVVSAAPTTSGTSTLYGASITAVLVVPWIPRNQFKILVIIDISLSWLIMYAFI